MSNGKRTRIGLRRATVTPLLALGAALFVVFTLVAPVLAVEGPTKLIDPRVAPRTGTPSTTIVFEVKYRNREGSAADHVSVIIDGTAHAMHRVSGTDWKSGIVHRWSTTLRVGTHAIRFEAADTRKFTDTVSGGTVTITATTPSSTPPPEPSTTPTTTPDATPAPGDSGSPTSGTDDTSAPTGGAGLPVGTDGTSSGGGDASDPDGPNGPLGRLIGPGTVIGSGSTGGGDSGSSGTGSLGAGSLGWSHGSDPGRNDPLQIPTAGDDGAGSTTNISSSDGASGSGGSSWGTLASALETLGIERPSTLTTIPMLVGTSSAMTMAFAFAIFGKKRRDEQPPAPDEVLQANAARGHGALPGSSAINGVISATAVPAPLDLEAGMPRWRRPSLLEARKADPTRSTASSHHMSFDGGLVPAGEGRERRIIRYSVVRLLDAPDELRSAEIGQLDRGDEVVLLERSGTYWLVLCPDGRQGWLHKMTLGDVVTDGAPGTSAVFNREEEDGLAAFLAARAQA